MGTDRITNTKLPVLKYLTNKCYKYLIPEPDHGMPIHQAQKYFKQLINGLVSLLLLIEFYLSLSLLIH